MNDIRIVEVGVRDGLQNEKRPVPTEAKRILTGMLVDAGITALEVGSFVSPKAVPQMADTAELLAQLPARPGVRYAVLVPNLRGMEGAIASRVEEIAIFGAASETFSQRNINCSIDESMARFGDVAALALEKGMKVRGYVSCAIDCPYEGPVDPDAVVRMAKRMMDFGCYEIAIADTIGTATPGRIGALIDQVAAEIPLAALAVHCHDTYGQALANILAALEKGVRIFDASISGLGGCPFAKGATGNVATEEVVYMLHGMGLSTGVDLGRLIAAGRYIDGILGREGGSKVARAILAKRG